MTTHTPGPFEIDTDRSILCRPQAERYGRDMISDVLPIAGVYSWMGPEEADANARLFGAADEMLVALKALVKQCDTEDHLGPMIAPSESAVKEARDVIAKIEAREIRVLGLAVETKGSIY